MRHLFITQDYAPDLGGMARRHVELCRRLAAESVLVSTVAAPDAADFDRGEPYPIDRQPFEFSGARTLGNRMRWTRWLVRQCRDGIDVVHCGNLRPAGYSAWWARARTGVPYLLYVYGGDLLKERRKARGNALKRRAMRRIFADAAGVVAISDWSRELAESLMRELDVDPAPPVAAIDLGTDPAWFSPARDTGALRRRLGVGDAPLLLTIARLVPHKGQDTVLDVLARVRPEFPALRYLVVGTGPDEPRLRDRAARLGVADRTIFAGVLTDDEIAEAYATATAYIGLSRVERETDAEGFGISFVEASASGLPVIAGRSGGVPNAVRDGDTGVLVPATDVDAVAAVVRRLLGDASLRARMGAAGRRAAETHYNWDRVARETLAFVRERVETAAAARSAS